MGKELLLSSGHFILMVIPSSLISDS